MAGSTEPREKAVPKYFRTTPEAPKAPDKPDYSKGRASLIVGVILALVGFLIFLPVFNRANFSNLCLGPIIAAVGGWLLLKTWGGRSAKKAEYEKKVKEHEAAMEVYKKAYEQAEPKPSDQQMDDWLNGDLARLKKEALQKLDLVPEQIIGNPEDPILVVGPGHDAALGVGQDDIFRFSKYDIVIVYLSDYHLAAYNCTLDMALGTQVSEATQEYHYTDVVSVSTQTEGGKLFVVTVNGEKKSIASYQKFALAVASGDRIEVVTSFPQLGDVIEKGKLAPTGADKAITIIRARLREKKGGVQI